MRIALCSQHLIFAEIFAHVLARRGENVIVMTSGLEAMLDDRLLEYADIAVVDVGAVRDCRQETFDALTARMPSLPVVALVEQDADIEDEAFVLLRPRAVCDKRQQFNDVLDTLDRVAAGGVVPRHRSVAGRIAPRRPRASRDHPFALTISPREQEVLCGLVRGEDTMQIANLLGISVATTRSHVQSILCKLDAHTRLAAVSRAIQLGLVDSRSAQWRQPAAVGQGASTA